MKPLLIFGYGNPGRGDDALGPALVEAIEAMELPQLECQTDMQLQVEHVTDLRGRKVVLFVDADMTCAEPFEMDAIMPYKDDSYTSHAMSPQALLYAYEQVYGLMPPNSFVLRIRGESFELGDGLSIVARIHLKAALQHLMPLCDQVSPVVWHDAALRGMLGLQPL